VFNQHDLAFLEQVLADDFVEHEEWPGLTPDKQGAIDFFTHAFKTVPDMRVDIHYVIASDDRVAIHATFSGTDEGGFLPGVPATGKSFSMEGIDIVRVNEKGTLAEHWGITDVMAAMMQLGVLQAPGS
jgi:steroid delta-isomerase-like uncharacterized protein